ncbi:MAG: hypothetical protein ND866_31520 [Pyrinomonadaceae bacterium]|nr:hypothetical protein [Pyrinomonadaceae bacterium]
MGNRLKGMYIFLVLVSLVSVSAIVAQQPRRRGPRPAAPANKPDLKIKYKMSTSGQTMESVTMLKGPRERSESNTGYMNMVSITQCDLKRTIQLSESARKYVITPMETSDSSGSAPSTAMPSGPAEPSRRGGIVTYTTTSIDTGERKEMFGFTASHIKSSTVTESSTDACNPMKQRIERDGWYIDFSFGLDCNQGDSYSANYPVPPGGCKDRVQFKQIGSARTGYPLIETTTMYGADGKVTFTSTKEVVELSRDPLDAALFDVPAGYTETQNSQELYGAPSMAETMGSAMTGGDTSAAGRTNEMSGMAETKQPGTVRVGVVTINNKSGRPVSVDSLRERLVNGIEVTGVDAVALNATTQAAAEAEAKARQCDFILYSDISSLKLSAAKKLGGILGGATGVSGIGRSDARVDFSLFAVGETSPRLQSSVTGKEEGDEASVGTALDSEARAVSAAVRKGR